MPPQTTFAWLSIFMPVAEVEDLGNPEIEQIFIPLRRQYVHFARDGTLNAA